MNTQLEHAAIREVSLQSGESVGIPRKRRYIGGLVLSIILWITFPCLFAYWFDPEGRWRAFGQEWLTAGNLSVVFVVAAVVYLIEAFCSPAFAYLRNLRVVEDVVSYIQRLRSYSPDLTFSCECSHDEMRTRVVTETQTDADGNSRTVTRTETYTETVVTYRESQAFRYARCEDRSAEMTDEIYRCAYTCIDFSLDCRPGNQETEERYQQEKADFIERNRHRDARFSFSERQTLQDFKPKLLSVVDRNRKSPLIHWSVYLLATLLMLSWPYRIWFERQTAHGKFQFRKLIYL